MIVFEAIKLTFAHGVVSVIPLFVVGMSYRYTFNRDLRMVIFL